MTGVKTRTSTKRKSLTEIPGKQAKKLNSNVESDLQKSLDTLQNKYDDLLIENKKNLEKICLLEKKVEYLQNPPFFRCDECEFPAEDLCDLGEHIYLTHNYDNSGDSYNCNYCEESFDSKNELMIHKKNDHEENVSICKYFLKDMCAFNDENCWYSHKKFDDSSCHKEMNKFICVICEETFDKKNEYMIHKKNLHGSNISICKNYKNQMTCHFGENCWFRHENNSKNILENQQNDKITEQILNMLEKFTERMLLLENEVKHRKTIHSE